MPCGGGSPVHTGAGWMRTDGTRTTWDFVVLEGTGSVCSTMAGAVLLGVEDACTGVWYDGVVWAFRIG